MVEGGTGSKSAIANGTLKIPIKYAINRCRFLPQPSLLPYNFYLGSSSKGHPLELDKDF
jgi:hypothetical protein